MGRGHQLGNTPPPPGMCFSTKLNRLNYWAQWTCLGDSFLRNFTIILLSLVMKHVQENNQAQIAARNPLSRYGQGLVDEKLPQVYSHRRGNQAALQCADNCSLPYFQDIWPKAELLGKGLEEICKECIACFPYFVWMWIKCLNYGSKST